MLSLRPAGVALQREYCEWSLLAVLCGAASMLPVGVVGSTALLGLYLALGPGLALFSLFRFPVVATLLTPVIGLAAASAATALLSQFSRFPTYSLLVAALMVNGGAAVWAYRYTTAAPADAKMPLVLVRVRKVGSAAPTLPRKIVTAAVPLLVLVVGLAVWCASISLLEVAPYSQYGLLASRGGAVLIVAASLVLFAIMIALRAGRIGVAWLGLLGLIAVLRGTSSIITEMPIFGWTYKHIGVVEYLQTYRTLPPSADIYGQWPSFFTLNAWFTSLTDIKLLTVAHLFTPLIHLLLAVGVIVLTRALRFSRRSAVAAAVIVEITNWVGQDYFSPQALALPLALAVLAVMVLSTRVPAAPVLGVFLFACLVPLHQLTPYWLMMVLVALVLGGWIKPWWVVVICGALLVLYLIPRFSAVSGYSMISSFNPVNNAQSNISGQGGTGKTVTTMACRGLGVSAFIVAAVAIVVLWRRQLPVWPQMAMAGSALFMLGGVNYGGEAIFRVFLYSIPGLAILIAPMYIGLLNRPRNLWRSLACTLAGLWFLLAGMQGTFALWGQVTVSRDQYEQAISVMQYPGQLRVVPMFSGGIPDRASPEYVEKALKNKEFDSPLVGTGPSFWDRFPMGQLPHITEAANYAPGQVFIAVTEQDMHALEYYGYITAEQRDYWLAQINQNPHWKVVFAGPDLRLYRFDPQEATT
ncbi:MAG: hypothetical protein ABWY93_27935 [Mycobacterium sp.]